MGHKNKCMYSHQLPVSTMNYFYKKKEIFDSLCPQVAKHVTQNVLSKNLKQGYILFSTNVLRIKEPPKRREDSKRKERK